ncbi:hypothetical protein SCHPADRAFT_678024 [Schizopora paradoxa]|uniref:Phenol 2-monooxygenase n=1 Tax=Schizopora paradoxa TaxID=27342 RepID=A0A0H2RPP1_9AGAM|nr:hypothetical protein SCHPADRAFT_678024 [Schizopora paradoxa]
MKESNVDVLIIGAGPAGLMASNAFAAAGVNVRVVDKRPSKVAAGQADGIQPRTIEVFQSYGLADRLIREGNQMHFAAFYNPAPGGGITRDGRAPDVTAPTARFPFEVTLHQGAIEAIFIDSMKSNGLQIDRPIVPESIEVSGDDSELNSPDSYPVKVVLRHLDAQEGESGTEVVHAKYVLGADGAHSWVRNAIGFTMDGEQTDYVWGVVDMVPTTDFPDIRNRCAIHSPSGSCMIIPREGDVVRLYLQLSNEDAKEVINAKGRIDRTKWGPDRLLEIAKRSLQPFTISFPKEVEWWTLYIIGQRVASSFSLKERVFIAGDACHTHSPKAGQGMNASMNDSHNLVWKITHVLRGWAHRSLLKTYEFERRKYAQDLINFDKKFSALFSGKPRTEDNQDGVSHEEFLEAFQTFGGFTSGIGIQYLPSPISRVLSENASNIASNLNIGTRMPPQIIIRAADARPFELHDLLPSDTRFKVIVFSGDINELGAQKDRLAHFASAACGEDGVLSRLGVKKLLSGRAQGAAGTVTSRKSWTTVFEVLTVMKGKKETVNYTSVPAEMVSHWSKVFVDDIEIKGINGGKAYESFGIGFEGAVVVVRPDGYIGSVLSLDDVQGLSDYFETFMS